MYNEALITMFAGYHPDSFWDPNDYKDMLPRVPEEKESPKEDSKNNVKSANNNLGDVSELRKIIELQGKELEQLRILIEGEHIQ